MPRIWLTQEQSCGFYCTQSEQEGQFRPSVARGRVGENQNCARAQSLECRNER